MAARRKLETVGLPCLRAMYSENIMQNIKSTSESVVAESIIQRTEEGLLR